MEFTKASRKKSKLRLALSGPSGSGKTTAMLKIAKGMGGRTAVIDTERGSASLYSDLHEFDTLELAPPFTPERFIEAIKAAESAGYDIICIDSITHEWDGPGGCLELNEKIAQSKYKGNTWAAWNETTPRHRAFLDAILQSPKHIIATMRSKTDTVQEGGKVRKVGTKAVQREGAEYEFTIVLDMEHDHHNATASKDRSRLFTDPQQLDETTGTKLVEWLNAGVDAPPEPPRKTEADHADDLEGKLADFELAFVECADLPALAALFPKANEAVKAFKELVSHDVYQGALARLAKAKDHRKAALTPADQVPPAATGAGSLPAVITPEQVSEIRKLAQKYKMTDDDLRKLCAVESIEVMPASVFDAACKMVETWGKKAKRKDDSAGQA